MERIEKRKKRRANLRRIGIATILLSPALAAAQMAPQLPATPGQTQPGATPIGAGANPDARRYTFTPGIRTSLVGSNNLELLPDSQAEAGVLVEVVPYIEARLDSPRGVGAAVYGLRGQWRNGGVDSTDDVRHDLRAWTDFKLTDEVLRLYASANVYDVNVSPFGVASFDPGSQANNRTQYRDFELSPYLFGRFDGEGTYLARYRLRRIDPGTGFSSSTSQAVSGEARTDLSRRRVGMSVRADAYDVNYEGNSSYAGADVDLLGWFRFDSALRIGLGVGYSRNDILFNDKGENEGWGPSAALEWVPDNRTSVRARWSDRYYGSTGEVGASYRAVNWTFGLDYSTGINDGARSGLNSVTSAGLFGQQNTAGTPGSPSANPVSQSLIDQGLLSGAGSSFGTGLVNSPLVKVDSLIASIGWLGSRNAFLGTAFINNRRTAVAFESGGLEDTDQSGGSIGFTHRLDGRNSVNLTGQYTVSDSATLDSQATLTSLLLRWDYRLSPRSIATLGARVQRQRGDGLTVEYDEAAVLASLDFRF
jgi:uncharacterized protein (PEP-CTERM system associated)